MNYVNIPLHLLQVTSHSKLFGTCNDRYLCYHRIAVYADDMPETLPAALFIRQLLRRASGIIRITLRAIVVVFVWLIMLPYITLWVWRFYFWSGDNLALSMHSDNSTTANTTLANEQNTVLNDTISENTISISLFSAR